MRKIWSLLKKPIVIFTKLIQRIANLFFGRPIHIYEKPFKPLKYYLEHPDESIESFWVLYDFEDYDDFDDLIHKHTDVIVREDPMGKTMIHYMACYGTSKNFEILKKFNSKLFNKLVFDQPYLPPLHCALYSMNGEVMDYFVNRLHISANILDSNGKNAAHIVDTLQESKSNLPMESLLLLAMCFDIELDHKSHNGDTILHAAVKEQNWQAIELLLSLHPNLVKQCNGDNQLAEKIAIDFHNMKLYRRLHDLRQSLINNQNAHQNQRFIDNRFRLTTYLIDLVLKPYFHLRLCFQNRWILLETIRNLIGVGVFFYQANGLFVERIPRYLSFYYAEHYENNEILHGLFLSNFLMGCIAFIAVYFGRTQFKPFNAPEYEQFMSCISDKRLTNKQRGVLFDDTVNLRFERPCHICKCFRFMNDKHCYTCNRCVNDYDHHCVFLFSCIGRKNIGAFITFLTSMTLGGVMSIYFLLGVMMPIYFHFELRNVSWMGWFSLPTNRLQHFILMDIMFSCVWLTIGAALLVTTFIRLRFSGLQKNIVKMKGFARRYWKKTSDQYESDCDDLENDEKKDDETDSEYDESEDSLQNDIDYCLSGDDFQSSDDDCCSERCHNNDDDYYDCNGNHDQDHDDHDGYTFEHHNNDAASGDTWDIV